MAQDGRTYYKYLNDDGTALITPKPLEEMTSDDIGSMRSLSLVDAPSGRMPQNLTVSFKDPQWAGHWFNKKARSGYRVGEARSMGFVPAKVEDLATYFAGLNDKDGALEDNDLVLMKIHKSKLYAKVVSYIADAKRKGSIGGYKEQANSMLGPKAQESDPFYHTPQALKEKQGLGPVEMLATVNQ